MPECGCTVRRHCVFLPEGPMEMASTIIFCPMHRAAADMMRLLQLETSYALMGQCECVDIALTCAHHAEIDRLLTKIKENDHAEV